LRRILSIALLLLFVLPAVSPLLGLEGGAQSNLPACCRRDGSHHCVLGMGVPSESGKALAGERCPFGERALPIVVHAAWTLDTAKAVFVGLTAHPTGTPQTECRRRLASLRARQKRGPPVVLL